MSTNDKQPTLEELRQRQRAFVERRRGNGSTAVVAEEQRQRNKAYAERLKRQEGVKSLDQILSEVDRQTFRPQKQLIQTLSLSDAKKLAYRIATKKAESQQREFIVDKDNKEVITQLTAYFCGDYSSTYLDPLKGVCLTGQVGSGKTFLMEVFKIFCDKLNDEQRMFKIRQCQAVYDAFYNSKELEALDKFYGAAWCFDDFGDEPTTAKHYGNEVRVMDKVINRRYPKFTNGHLVTHMTTNLDIFQIETKYGKRISERVRHLFNIVLLNGNKRNPNQ